MCWGTNSAVKYLFRRPNFGIWTYPPNPAALQILDKSVRLHLYEERTHCQIARFAGGLPNSRPVISRMAGKPKNVVFFHPDLGIGGAERLIVDAAVGLQELGHKVTIFTSHCDKGHCFDEARDSRFSHAVVYQG